ncbi:transcription termination/antitermination protein NusG [Gimesia sp.]|uniref:transcription termination/antitermination protein NusG n=1 Tax=Gimesia sp. TaxID=2024833 RepID=UPI003A928A97
MSNDSGSEPTSESPEGSEKRLWYVLKVQSNREKSIRDALLRGIKRDGLEEYFGEIIIPTEKVVETKGGKKRVFERKLYPGYLMIQVELNDDSWYLVRSTNGVGDFTGAAGKPIPMQEHEISRMLGREESKEETPVKIKLDFQVGDVVKVKDATFEGFEGTIDAVDEASGKVTVLIEIFSRPTPTELEYWQIEKV